MLLGDAGQGISFRPGTFDGAIRSVSAAWSPTRLDWYSMCVRHLHVVRYVQHFVHPVAVQRRQGVAQPAQAAASGTARCLHAAVRAMHG